MTGLSVLLTGGLGFIGSHTATLLKNAETIIIIDDCSNSSPDVIDKIRTLIPDKIVFFYRRSLHCDSVEDIFQLHEISSVIHFAGLKSVSESVKNPLKYFDINIGSTINLLKMCARYKVKHFIFSSSATVYGDSSSPLTENSPVGNGISNPYGTTKFMIEEMLKDCFKSLTMSIVILRYFNPVGAHPSGLLGENPSGVPNNLMPYIMRVAINKSADETHPYHHLSIYGKDYETPDGTAIRDYIHVMDLGEAHVKALDYCTKQETPILEIFNIGTGIGVSVQQMVDTFSKVNQIPIKYVYKDRRSGDVAITYTVTTKAETILGFKPTRTLEDMVRDSLNYAIKNT